jgi:predicted esterase
MRRFSGGAVAAMVVLMVATTLPAETSARGARPDLRVPSGAVSASGGKLEGSFVVVNRGAARAGSSAAALVVGTPGGDREVARLRLRPVWPGGSRTLNVATPVPTGLPPGSLPLRVCADPAAKVREKREGNNCHRVGVLTVANAAPAAKAGPPALPTPSGPPSSVPSNPIPFEKEMPFLLASPASGYWVYVPSAYDASHATPTPLLVWLHGCGGESAGDIYVVDPGGSQDWISIAVGGREGACWDPAGDQAKVLAAIADLKTHFNVNPRRVILGGYSSGGDLAYRTAFYNANSFAGVLAANTSPFRDTGSSAGASLAAAAWKFNVVHVAHLQDATYPIAGVREETDAMAAAGFPVQRIELTGTHFDEPGDLVGGNPVPGTDADIVNYLLPHIGDGWLSP